MIVIAGLVPKLSEVCAQMEHEEVLNFGLRCNEKSTRTQRGRITKHVESSSVVICPHVLRQRSMVASWNNDRCIATKLVCHCAGAPLDSDAPVR
jgi:hypothetical protein